MSINLIKDWFYYSQAQRQGIIVLLALLVAIPIISEIIKSRVRVQQIDQEAFLAEVRLFEELLAQAEAEAAEASSLSRSASSAGREQAGMRIVFEPFAFDPNHLSLAEWDSLGMPRHISRSIQNFLAAGGGFRYKEDFKRIFLLEDWMYDELEGYIELPLRPVANSPPRPIQHNDSNSGSAMAHASETNHSTHISHTSGYQKADKIPLIVNINTADTTELQSIRGIGPAFSRRIVGYRELLGGFTHTEQLMEVFGLDSTRFEQIRDFVVTDSIVGNKVKLNVADFGDLVRHPYIDRQTAGAILNLRRQHGPFHNIDDLKKSYLIDDEMVQSLLPYVCIEAVEEDISKNLSD